MGAKHGRIRPPKGRNMSPLTILAIMARAEDGESASKLSQEFSLAASTVGRWLNKWGRETEFYRLGRTAVQHRAQELQALQATMGQQPVQRPPNLLLPPDSPPAVNPLEGDVATPEPLLPSNDMAAAEAG